MEKVSQQLLAAVSVICREEITVVIERTGILVVMGYKQNEREKGLCRQAAQVR
jgi:hypothetical protein